MRELRDLITARSLVEIAAAILIALGVFQLIHAAVDGLIITPIESNNFFGEPGIQPLDFRIGGALFFYGSVLSYAITLAIIGLLLYALVRSLRRRVWSEDATKE